MKQSMSGSEAAVSLDSIMLDKILPHVSTPQLPNARSQGLGPLKPRKPQGCFGTGPL